MKEFLTPKQVAVAIGVSEASIKRWCDQGVLGTTRTAGGHRRLPISEVIHFLTKNDRHLVQPEILGLPLHTGKSQATFQRACLDLVQCLEKGEEEGFRRIILNLLFAGHGICEICDEVISRAFHEIGNRWSCNELDVYAERRGTEICLRGLRELHMTLPPLPENAPSAIGGTFSGDYYQIPITMVEICLRDAGWNAQSLGDNLPVATLTKALGDLKPHLFWLSVSHIDNPEHFLGDYRHLFEAAQNLNIPIVIGGNAVTKPLREKMKYAAFCDNIHHLVDFAKTLIKAN